MARKKVDGKLNFVSDVAKGSAKSIGDSAAQLMKIAGILYVLGFGVSAVKSIVDGIKSKLPKGK
jgi:hypothetical protein